MVWTLIVETLIVNKCLLNVFHMIRDSFMGYTYHTFNIFLCDMLTQMF